MLIDSSEIDIIYSLTEFFNTFVDCYRFTAHEEEE